MIGGISEAAKATMGAFLTAELTTISRRGFPITWPVLPSIEWTSGRIAVVTSIGLPQKALNIRRCADVCLLFSEPAGSGLRDPVSVLVEGTATAPDAILTSLSDIADPAVVAAFERDALSLLRRQPAVGIYTANPVTRALMDWYFLRILITITPHRVHWGKGPQTGWECRDVA